MSLNPLSTPWITNQTLTPFLEKARARFDLNVPLILPYSLNIYTGAVSLYHVSQTE